MPQLKEKLIYSSHARILRETVQVAGEALLHRITQGLIPTRLCLHWHSAHWITGVSTPAHRREEKTMNLQG